MKPRHLLAIAAACIYALGLPCPGQAQEDVPDPFPHARHEGLFPLCAGCHLGADPASPGAALFPEARLCEGCHNGVDESRVSWVGPDRIPSNVRFTHADHEARVRSTSSDPVPECTSCHAPDLAEPWQVQRAVPTGCLSCHAHEAVQHVQDADCATCHVPLGESGLSTERVAALAPPPDHDRQGFLLEGHGEAALAGDMFRCSTCHTQERCTSCHVVGPSGVEQIAPAADGMTVPTHPAEYPRPSSHGRSGFARDHVAPGTNALASCGTCHTREDCASCHREPVPSAVSTLPTATRTVAPGVQLVRARPDSHAWPLFESSHGPLALEQASSCTTCHREETCTTCHDGARSDAFHPLAFSARHAAEAFGSTMECSTCHSTEVFCRQCHVESGLGSSGRLGPGYHDAQPVWLLRHGQAARQALESCASCHQQRDCLQCHSTLGAFQVSPHGPDFDADRAWRQSSTTCRACHVGDPR